MTFFEITGNAYTDLLRRRLAGDLPELTWLQQFRDLLHPHLAPGTSFLDIGCGTGYAYKSFADFGINYTGADVEDIYLSIAKEYFAGREDVKFIKHDISAAPSPVRADIVICSAMLEHMPSMMPALGNLAGAAQKVLVLRTFLAQEEEVLKLPSPVKEHRSTAFKYSNQYSFAGILRALHKLGFSTVVHPDRYTQSMPHLVDGQARTFYVLVATRPADPKGNDPRDD